MTLLDFSDIPTLAKPRTEEERLGLIKKRAYGLQPKGIISFDDLPSVPVRERVVRPEVKPEMLQAAHQAMTTPPTQYPFEAKQKATDTTTIREKGLGYFGELKRPDGKISTELSIGVNMNGKETEIPSLVSILTKPEIDYLLAGNKPTREIVQKAVDHAKQRITEGKNVFAQLGEQIPIAEIDFSDLPQIRSVPEKSPLMQFLSDVKQKIREKTGYFEPPITGPTEGLLKTTGYRAEEPLKTLVGAGGFLGAKYLSGLGLNIPDIITHKVSGAESLAQLVNNITGFRPKPKEIGAGEQADFIGGLTTAGGISGKLVKNIAARQALKTILQTGITFGLRKTGEEIADKFITGDPISIEGIHFEAGLGELFGAGEVGVDRLARFIQGVRAGKAIIPYEAPAGTKEAHRAAVRKEIQTALTEYKTTGDRTKWDAVRQKYTIGEPFKPVAEVVKPAPTIAAKPSVGAVGAKIPAKPTTWERSLQKRADKAYTKNDLETMQSIVDEMGAGTGKVELRVKELLKAMKAKAHGLTYEDMIKLQTMGHSVDDILKMDVNKAREILGATAKPTIEPTVTANLSSKAEYLKAHPEKGILGIADHQALVRDALDKGQIPYVGWEKDWPDLAKAQEQHKAIQAIRAREVPAKPTVTAPKPTIEQLRQEVEKAKTAEPTVTPISKKELRYIQEAPALVGEKQLGKLLYDQMDVSKFTKEDTKLWWELYDNQIEEYNRQGGRLVKGEAFVEPSKEMLKEGAPISPVEGYWKTIDLPPAELAKVAINFFKRTGKSPFADKGTVGKIITILAEYPDLAKQIPAVAPIEGQMKLPPTGKPGFAVIPEFLQGRKGLGLKLYQDIFNRFAAIEDVTKKAVALGMKVQPGEDPGKRARGYLGIAGKAQRVLEHTTFRITSEGKIESTGEGLKLILNDYELQGKVLGKPEGLLKTNFKEYLKATRTIEDLQRPPYEGAKREIVTPEQVKEATNTINKLNTQYGEKISILKNTAKRLYDYQLRMLHLLVDSGNLSEGQFQNILKANQHYIPFDRVMDDIEPTGVSPVSKQRFTGARAPVKRIKGSEREIYDPIESVVKNTYRIMDAAERNTVARNVARLGEVLPEAIKPREIPIIPLAKVPLKAGIDPKLTGELLSVIDTLKGEYERKLKIGGRRMGYFKPQKQIVTKFGTSEGVIAHELGHYIDELYGLKERLVKNPETIKELRALADLRQVRRAYARKGEEKIAALMDAFVTKPFILDDVAPNSKRILTSIINEHEELKPLLKIRPSMEIQYEKAVQTIFGQSPFKPKGNVIEYFENGKRKYIEVSPELYQAMSGMDEISSSLYIQLLSKPAQWLQVGATITPEFAFRNPLRDQWTAFMQTNVGFIPFIDTGRAIADILGKSNLYWDYLGSGAAQSGFVEMTRPALQKAVKELNRHPNLLKRLNIITDMQDLSQLMERGTRVGVYEAGIRKGLTPVEAGFISRESTLDFARRGAKTRDVNKVIAFFNAGMQGLDATVRTFAKRPISTTLKGIAVITIPSLLLYLKNRNDPEYKEIPAWQKDLFWVTKVDDTYVRIPKPFLYGQIFGSIPERLFEYFDTKDKSAFDGLAKSVYESVSPVTGDPAGGILPTAIRPLVENYVNWNFFLDRKIIPEGKEKLLPPEQYGRYTSDTAKKLGELLGYSPSKIENLARGWFGGTAQYALGASDYLLNAIRKEAGVKIPEKPKEFEQMPLVRGFTIKPPTETGQAESIEKFYDFAEKITSIYLTANKFVKDKKMEDAKRLILAHPEVKHYPIIGPTSKILSELNQAVDSILKDTKLTSKEKEEKIEQIQKARVRLVQKVNRELKK